MTCRAGRPPFKVTKENREQVEILTAARLGEPVVADAIGCSPRTLRQHFRDQLDHGASRANARVVQAIYSAAVTGNSGAARLWLDLARVRPPHTRQPPPLGKKQQAEAALKAAEQTSNWRKFLPRSPPPGLSAEGKRQDDREPEKSWPDLVGPTDDPDRLNQRRLTPRRPALFSPALMHRGSRWPGIPT